jgi:carbonic anhydrase/acetyltransferase-like protein (isoleucine patch superfamily)
MALFSIDGIAPQLHPSAWVAESAEVIGRVELAEDVSIWFGTVIRGDQPEPVRIGRASNIQDGCVLHSDPGMPLTVGEAVTVGHRVVLHGCSIGDGALIGIGAVILNGARIGKRCLVGAGALVTEGKEFPEGSLIVGSPAVVKRALSVDHLVALRHGAEVYLEKIRRYRGTLTKVG